MNESNSNREKRIVCSGHRSRWATIFSVVGLLSIGCGGPETALLQSLGIPIPPADALAPVSVVGGAPNRVIFSRFDYATALSSGGLSQAAEAQLVTVDLTAGGTVSELPSTLAAEGAVSSDGQWIATVDYTNNVLLALNLDSGATQELFAGPVQTGLQPLALDAGRLLIAVQRGGQVLLVLRDLNTGAQTAHVENLAMTSGAAALRGNILALRTYPPLDPNAPFDLEAALATRIEFVDLTTDARATVATIADDTPGGFLGIGSTQIVWTEPTPTATLVRVFDTQRGTAHTLIELPPAAPTSVDYAYIDGVDRAGVLISRTRVNGDLASLSDVTTTTSHESLELVGFDGVATVIDEFDQGLNEPAYYSTAPAVIGQFVIFRKAKTGQWLAYDTVAQTTSEFAPF